MIHLKSSEKDNNTAKTRVISQNIPTETCKNYITSCCNYVESENEV